MDTKVHFSSKRHDWGTPVEFFNRVNDRYKLEIDSCATDENRKLPRYFGPDHTDPDCRDCFTADWGMGKKYWMNPPYGREIGRFIEKAWFEGQYKNNLVVCLVPARTDTQWWHNYVIMSERVYFIKGRLKFDGHKNSAPFPSALVVFSHRQMIDPVRVSVF